MQINKTTYQKHNRLMTRVNSLEAVVDSEDIGVVLIEPGEAVEQALERTGQRVKEHVIEAHFLEDAEKKL